MEYRMASVLFPGLLTTDGIYEDWFKPFVDVAKPVVGDIIQTQWVRAVVVAEEKPGIHQAGTRSSLAVRLRQDAEPAKGSGLH